MVLLGSTKISTDPRFDSMLGTDFPKNPDSLVLLWQSVKADNMAIYLVPSSWEVPEVILPYIPWIQAFFWELKKMK